MMKCPTEINVSFWTFVLRHSVEIINNTPLDSGVTRNDIFTCTRGLRDFKQFHTFECPTFSLNPTLQKGDKIPAWEPRLQRKISTDKSRLNASNVNLVFEPRTRHISPQFNLVFDEYFSTTLSAAKNNLSSNLKGIFQHNTEHCADD